MPGPRKKVPSSSKNKGDTVLVTESLDAATTETIEKDVFKK